MFVHVCMCLFHRININQFINQSINKSKKIEFVSGCSNNAAKPQSLTILLGLYHTCLLQDATQEFNLTSKIHVKSSIRVCSSARVRAANVTVCIAIVLRIFFKHIQ